MKYDIAIIGAGPAGLTAGLYAGRAKMKTVVVSENIPGGQAMLTDEIENYPGFSGPVKGPELMQSMYEQAQKAEISFETASVEQIIKKEGVFELKTSSGTIESVSVIVATGAAYKKLGAEGEEKFTGRGVSYCGVCDAPFFKNKEIAVIGGGDTAVYEASHLLKYASRLHLVHRRDRLRATKIMQDKVLNDPKTTVHWDSVLEEICGANTVEGIKIKNIKTGNTENIQLKGVFIFIGIDPASELVKEIAKTDEAGYVITNDNMETSCPGLFACGDVRKKALRQISTAVGEGALAAFSSQLYTEKLKGEAYI